MTRNKIKVMNYNCSMLAKLIVLFNCIQQINFSKSKF